MSITRFPGSAGAGHSQSPIDSGTGRRCNNYALRESFVWSILLTFTDLYMAAAHSANGTLAVLDIGSVGGGRFHAEIAMPLSEYTMNIFYIIGVIVVVVVVAGFFGVARLSQKFSPA